MSDEGVWGIVSIPDNPKDVHWAEDNKKNYIYIYVAVYKNIQQTCNSLGKAHILGWSSLCICLYTIHNIHIVYKQNCPLYSTLYKLQPFFYFIKHIIILILKILINILKIYCRKFGSKRIIIKLYLSNLINLPMSISQFCKIHQMNNMSSVTLAKKQEAEKRAVWSVDNHTLLQSLCNNLD